jgi:hypothetical protein
MRARQFDTNVDAVAKSSLAQGVSAQEKVCMPATPSRGCSTRAVRIALLAAVWGFGACVQSVDKGKPVAVMVQARPTPKDAGEVGSAPGGDASGAGSSPFVDGGGGDASGAGGDASTGAAPPSSSPFPTFPSVDAFTPPLPSEMPGMMKACLSGGSPCVVGASTCCGRGAYCFKGGLETVCVAECLRHTDCANGCCAILAGGKTMCAPKNLCDPNYRPPATGGAVATPDAGRPAAGCGRLVMRASDGQFLGLPTATPNAADSVCNQSTRYGGTTAADSIFNPAGPYGSLQSPKSAYHPTTTTPPTIQCENSGRRRYWITKNPTLPAPRLDPDTLCTTLAANFL